MGSKHDELREIYGRGPLTMSRQAFIRLAQQAGRKYRNFSVYVLSASLYDLSGVNIPGRAFIEIDCPINADQLGKFLNAFEECHALIPIYQEGIMGEAISDYPALLQLADPRHTITFAAYQRDQETLRSLPPHAITFNLDTIFAPHWAHWDSYTNFDLALKNSKTYYHYIQKSRAHPVFFTQ